MRLCLALIAAALAAVPAARAQPTGAVAQTALIGGWSEPNGTRMAAIEIRLAPGWHTYWRVPGTTGIPPDFDWSGSRNLASVAYLWPRPQIIETQGTFTIGYEDGLVLPVRLTPADPGQPIDVALDLFFGACENICVPAEATLRAQLTLEDAATGRNRIEAALAARPRTAAEAGIASIGCTIAPGRGGFEVTSRMAFREAPVASPLAVLETARPDTWVSGTRSRTEGRVVTVTARIEGTAKDVAVMARDDLRFTLIEAERAIDLPGCPAPG